MKSETINERNNGNNNGMDELEGSLHNAAVTLALRRHGARSWLLRLLLVLLSAVWLR